MLCAWHVQKNFISHFSNLSRTEPELYHQALSLPFVACKDKFEKIVSAFLKSKKVTKINVNYLKKKLEKKKQWAKSYIKDIFAGGVSTTSRVEGLHSVLKKYLTSDSRLTDVFLSFRSLEKTQISKFSEEYQKKNTNMNEVGINSFIEVRENHSEYIFKKISASYFQGLNYVREDVIGAENKWYIFFLFLFKIKIGLYFLTLKVKNMK